MYWVYDFLKIFFTLTKEGNVLFNNTLNTLYLWLYGKGPFREHGLLFLICHPGFGALARTRNSLVGPPWRIDPTTHRFKSDRSYHWAYICKLKFLLWQTSLQDSCRFPLHHERMLLPRSLHLLEWEIAQWVHREGSIQRPIAPWVNALTTELTFTN